MTISRRATSNARPLVLACLLLGLIALPLLTVGRRADAAPGANWSRSIVTGAQGGSLADPAPLQTETTAGPWKLTVLEVVTGDDATNLVTGASSMNQAPSDGFSYVAARIKATNAGTLPYQIDGNDFGVVGDSGLVRRFIGAVAPDPALEGVVEPGESLEGWVVGGALDDDANLILLFDSATLTGNWADAAFALTDRAMLAAADKAAVEVNEAGRSPERAAGLDTAVVTKDWAVEVVQVVSGADVANLFPASDYRTTALIGSDPSVTDGWVAFQVRVTNNRAGGEPAYFPATAFTLADGDGNAVPDLSTLTAPDPDAAGAYYPGASREGWVVFDAAGYGGSLLRFQPYRSDEDVRYIDWGGGSSTPREPAFTGTLETGTNVVTNEDLVNLRDKPSTGGDVVEEMPGGTRLTVTGPPEDGDGYTWYPVENPDTGDKGYVAQDFIEPAD